MDQLVLAGDLSDQMSDEECSEITKSINNLFNESDYDNSWELIYYAKNQWFLLSDFQLINQAIPKDKIGKPLARPDSSDDASNYWIQTLNEIQMLLFSMPLNQLRLNESRQQCNSLWIWGESFLSGDSGESNSKNNNHWDKVYTNDYLVQQLALYRGQSYQDIVAVDSILKDDTSSKVLIVLNELEQAIEAQDVFAIITVLNSYEELWFKPLKQAILVSSIESLCIQSNAKESFKINRRSLKSWWKRNKKTGQILESL